MLPNFWHLLTICHLVMVQEKGNQLLYQAAFPDEKVLITQAPALQLHSRGMHSGQYRGHSHSGREGNSADSGNLVAEHQNLPHINMAMVINREFLDKLLLFQSKEPQVLVQNVNVDEQESWKEPGEQRTVVLQARCISPRWQFFGIQVKSTELVLENKTPSPTRQPQGLDLGILEQGMKFKVMQTPLCIWGSTCTYSVNTKSFLIFWGFPILHRVMVSMAMFIIDEFICLGNSIFINLDMWIKYESKEMAAKPHRTSINNQLGQVKYIFSDKTGTLTPARHDFKKCCINAIVYCPDEDEALH
ncbi:hypothetical protein QTO34_015839 [Cnephaeus nilssonii]|uniref:Uncharacterized protein n=1 Tax=Cnephaeus nilssonii TaxID=3371016 RepID=A0AA40LTA7_CNENI|nr:hypothetical protein QTO34_015839 [Eptesicus nilssonii]